MIHAHKIALIASLALITMLPLEGKAEVKIGENVDGRISQDAFLLDEKNSVTTLIGNDQRPILLNLWATWCPPCVRELPSLQELSELRPDLRVILAGQDNGGINKILKFTDKLRIDRGIVYSDPRGRLASELGMVGLPTTYFIQPNGQITLKFLGEADWTDKAILDQIDKDLK